MAASSGWCVAVAGEDVGGEFEEAGKLAAGVGVVLDDDVGAEELEGGSAPLGLGESGAAGGELEGEQDGVGVEVNGGAGGGEGLVATAAVVDAKVLEYTDGGGLVEGDFANGCGGGQVLCGVVGCCQCESRLRSCLLPWIELRREGVVVAAIEITRSKFIFSGIFPVGVVGICDGRRSAGWGAVVRVVG